MKRVSKREMRNKFSLMREVRVHVDSLEQWNARVVIDGIACDLMFDRKARWEIARPEGVPARVIHYPEPENDGQFLRGTRPERPLRSRGVRRTPRPLCEASGRFSQQLREAGATFAARYPVGSLVSARVIRTTRDGVVVELPGGLRARLLRRACLDKGPGGKWRLLREPYVGEKIEVVVRAVEPQRGAVLVSWHNYWRDSRYCAVDVGYRRVYRIEDSLFRRLPGQR